MNARWIVHAGLNRDADDYMRYLEATDPARLQRSCRNARLMVGVRDRTEDPKPWFYAGLLSLATAAEAEQFAGRHWLTYAAVSREPKPCPYENSDAALEKLYRIREALARLPR